MTRAPSSHILHHSSAKCEVNEKGPPAFAIKLLREDYIVIQIDTGASPPIPSNPFNSLLPSHPSLPNSMKSMAMTHYSYNHNVAAYAPSLKSPVNNQYQYQYLFRPYPIP
jgi:hypothetical protein